MKKNPPFITLTRALFRIVILAGDSFRLVAVALCCVYILKT